jgi:transcriptional/translational regulatory protein YebC/TACO1
MSLGSQFQTKSMGDTSSINNAVSYRSKNKEPNELDHLFEESFKEKLSDLKYENNEAIQVLKDLSNLASPKSQVESSQYFSELEEKGYRVFSGHLFSDDETNQENSKKLSFILKVSEDDETITGIALDSKRKNKNIISANLLKPVTGIHLTTKQHYFCFKERSMLGEEAFYIGMF